MPRTIRNRLALATLGLSLAVCPFAGQASAQATGDRTGADTGMATTRAERDDRGFNPGWLGLLGLLGLAGLMPRKAHAVATHRSGDTSGR